MLIRVTPPHPIKPSEITPEAVYQDRRRFLSQIGLAAAGLAVAGCGKAAEDKPKAAASADAGAADTGNLPALKLAKKSELAGGEKLSSFEDITTYNNYYEYGTGKAEPAHYAEKLKPAPWKVAVEGECDAPGIIDVDDLIKTSALEERIYRHRCVEAWSIVVPWAGVPLAEVLKRFKPNSKAKYVAFYTLADDEQMPMIKRRVLPFPYREGLRIDEAMHPLAMLTVGLYGKRLPNQNGAPIRLTVPWKYGFKCGKSIVKIKFVEALPETTWNFVGPGEYGFYANVNPEVDHPRWSQASERRLGELFRRPTLPFNGYPEVASLYAGMDLRKFY
ncbi:MAG: protein-methionine-sulfoxide reductase catalytic subunit MsrP [Nevskia sp.]